MPVDRREVEDRIAAHFRDGVRGEVSRHDHTSSSRVWSGPRTLTKIAIVASVATIAWSLAFLLVRYPRLPWLLPVHFRYNGVPNGWQFKTYWRVLLPVFVQIALALTLGAVGALLLSRAHGAHDEHAPDVKAAATAAETVALLTLIWVVFQGVRRASRWRRCGSSSVAGWGLGTTTSRSPASC